MARCEIRRADADDADSVAELAVGLAQSFTFSRPTFLRNYLRRVLDRPSA